LTALTPLTQGAAPNCQDDSPNCQSALSETSKFESQPAVWVALSRSAAGDVGCSTETGSDAGKVFSRAWSSALKISAEELGGEVDVQTFRTALALPGPIHASQEARRLPQVRRGRGRRARGTHASSASIREVAAILNRVPAVFDTRAYRICFSDDHCGGDFSRDAGRSTTTCQQTQRSRLPARKTPSASRDRGEH
jgi:hypothetical protein